MKIRDRKTDITWFVNLQAISALSFNHDLERTHVMSGHFIPDMKEPEPFYTFCIQGMKEPIEVLVRDLTNDDLQTIAGLLYNNE